MNQKIKTMFDRLVDQHLTPENDCGPVAWAEANIDYSRVKNYDTEWRGQYSADYMPYWREIMEAAVSDDVRETWIWKCSRCGGSENALLTTMRYIIAVRPQPTLYVSGQQQSTERFFEYRVKAGMGLSAETAKRFAQSKVREHEIIMPAMDIIATWPASKMGFKQSGYSFVMADEVSTWPEFASDMLRERMQNYSMPHLIGLSSSDPARKGKADEDPIIVEYNKTDMREWVCKDPVTGNDFVFRFGNLETKYGVKWDKKAKREDGTWDLALVAASAHYVTPDGTRIDDTNRMTVVRTGRWVATSTGIPARRGYRVTRFMVPFQSSGFSAHACKFLEANTQGKTAIKVFVCEWLTEQWNDDVEQVNDDEIILRHNTTVSIEDPSTFLTLDIQKESIVYVVRQWGLGGRSVKIAHGRVFDWESVEGLADFHNVTKIYADNSYTQRQSEVYDQCIKIKMIPTFGRVQLMLPYSKRIVDPYEGKSGAGSTQISAYTFNPDIFKSQLYDMIRGASKCEWWINDTEADYVKQMSAEECVGGIWKMRRNHLHNHFFDCEVLQVLAATIEGLLRD